MNLTENIQEGYRNRLSKTALKFDNSGREIAPNTGANATKFFTLATKFWKLVAKLATWMFHHNLTKRYSELKKICKDKSAANFPVKFASKMPHLKLDQ